MDAFLVSVLSSVEFKIRLKQDSSKWRVITHNYANLFPSRLEHSKFRLKCNSEVSSHALGIYSKSYL